MPKIHFEGAGLARDKTVDAPEGGELVDLCDQVLAPIAFSCRSASCGTCHITVLEGAELLMPPSPEEAELLALLQGPEGAVRRLACQARVRPGEGQLRVRPLLD